MPKIISAIERANNELQDVHRPDNGLMSTALEVTCLRFLNAELKNIKEGQHGMFKRAEGLSLIDDDSILGCPDKIMFFTKEMAASSMDPEMAQNPLVIGKLEIEEIKKIDFKPYMGYIDPAAHPNPQRDAELPALIDHQKI